MSIDKELIERLAKQAGCGNAATFAMAHYLPDSAWMVSADSLQRFAALISEECAKVAEETLEDAGGTPETATYGEASADAIRAKFKTGADTP